MSKLIFSAPHDYELATRMHLKYDSAIIRDKYFLFFKGWASQWYQCRFVVDKIEYNCAEQFMMAEKARIFNDYGTLKEILHASSPNVQKKLGRQITPFDETTWNNYAKQAVFNGNIAKFSQNFELKASLLSTGNLVLVEASPYDKIWGIGMNEHHTDATNPDKWQGKNWLGEVLMQVRDELLRENTSSPHTGSHRLS